MEPDLALADELRPVVTRLYKKLRKEWMQGSTLSLSENTTLWLLDKHGPLLPSELADMIEITCQSMSSIINHLHELHYIQRTPSLEDKRKVIVSLTEDGKKVVAAGRRELTEWLAKAIRAMLSEEEKKTLHEATLLLTRLADFA